MVDCGAGGRKGRGGRHAGSVLEGGGPLCGGKYAGPKEKLQPIYEDRLRPANRWTTMRRPVHARRLCRCIANTCSHKSSRRPIRGDLGLALTNYKGKLPKRIIDTGGLAKKDRITHRIELKSTDQIVSEVKKWLKTACDLDA